MRQHHKHLLREFMAEQVKRYRSRFHLTQETMAEQLHITPRSYIDLEHNRYGCSALTIIFFLLLLDREALHRLLDELRRRLEEDYHDAV